jgi:hypothetical protein
VTWTGWPSGRGLAGPLELFATWIHEASHAFIGVVCGADITRVDLSVDGSGVTGVSAPPSDTLAVAVGSAGYVGTVVVGSLLVAVGRWPRVARITLGVLGGLMVLSALLWMPSAFAFGLSFGIGALLVVLAILLPDRWARFLATGLGALTVFEGLARLVDVGDGTTDAVLTSHASGVGVGVVRGVWIVLGVLAALVGLIVRLRKAVPDAESLAGTASP